MGTKSLIRSGFTAPLISGGTIERIQVGPFLSSAGNTYTFLNTAGGDIGLWKATGDALTTTNWAETQQATAAGAVILNLFAAQEADLLHVCTVDANDDWDYFQYNMATDAWDVLDQAIATDNKTPNSGGGVMVRSDGDVILAHGGVEKVMGTDFNRNQYSRREGGSWTSQIAVSPIEVQASWRPTTLVAGSSDRAHIFYMEASGSNAYQRTLQSDNTLQSAGSSIDTNILGFAQGDSYLTGGTTRVSIPYVKLAAIRTFFFDSGDTPTISNELVGQSSHNQAGGSVGIRSVALIAEGEQFKIMWFRDSTTAGGAWKDTKAEGGSWGTDVSETAIDLDMKDHSARLITRDGATYHAAVMSVILGRTDSQMGWYWEEQITAAPAGALQDMIGRGIIPAVR